jgi:hypothetical protein
MLQLLLTRTNQYKPELCRCGLSSDFVWGQVGVESKGVAKYCTLLNTHIWLCEEGGGKVNSNHIKILAFQLMIKNNFIDNIFLKAIPADY